MRELIEPALKTMARTGLFLGVTAWIVSQWWAIGVSWAWPGGESGGTLFHCGWAGMVTLPIGIPTRIDYGITEREDMYADFFNSSILLLRESGSVCVAVRHYLIVSTFTIFNAALWLFYRKPKEVMPCES